MWWPEVNAKIETVADSAILRLLGRGALALMIPAFIWFGSKLISIDQRLGNVETIVQLKAPDIYPRGEAAQAFSTVNARIDGLGIQIQSNTHRIGALEDRDARR